MTDMHTNGTSDSTITVTHMNEVTELVTPDRDNEADGTNTITQALDPDRYRPRPSTDKVHEAVVRGLHDIAWEAAHQACEFMTLTRFYDKDKSPEVRYGHLVDAAECLELSLLHLDRLKDEVFHRMQLDEQPSGEDRC
jgi:hypothetical protein